MQILYDPRNYIANTRIDVFFFGTGRSYRSTPFSLVFGPQASRRSTPAHLWGVEVERARRTVGSPYRLHPIFFLSLFLSLHRITRTSR